MSHSMIMIREDEEQSINYSDVTGNLPYLVFTK